MPFALTCLFRKLFFSQPSSVALDMFLEPLTPPRKNSVSTTTLTAVAKIDYPLPIDRYCELKRMNKFVENVAGVSVSPNYLFSKPD